MGALRKQQRPLFAVGLILYEEPESYRILAMPSSNTSHTYFAHTSTQIIHTTIMGDTYSKANYDNDPVRKQIIGRILHYMYLYRADELCRECHFPLPGRQRPLQYRPKQTEAQGCDQNHEARLSSDTSSELRQAGCRIARAGACL